MIGMCSTMHTEPHASVAMHTSHIIHSNGLVTVDHEAGTQQDCLA